MPLVTIHLLALSPEASIPAYLTAIHALPTPPLLISRAIRWIIKPEKLSVSELLDTKWDLLLIYPADSPLKKEHLSGRLVSAHFTLQAGVPKSLLENFQQRNQRLLRPQAGDVPALTSASDNPRKASSAQGLELDDELLSWSREFKLGEGAVSMLNLLAFKKEEGAHASYQKYGKGFASHAGAKRGGLAKVVGKVVGKESEWDEIALAHYPSIQHFVDMVGSEEYQEINHKFRLPALLDTCILCTSELDPEVSGERARL